MFIRLNKSKPLTGAELRNAMKGQVPKFTRQIISHHFFEDRVRFNTQRGQDANVAAKLLLIEFRGKFVDTKKVHLDRLVDDVVAAESSSLENAYKIIAKVLGYMDSSFITKDPLLSSSGLIPIYYWFYRTYGEANKAEIRNFLVQFENNRKASRKKTLKDQDYADFDKLTRSINDQTSLLGAYNLLSNKWEVWKTKGSI